MNNPLPDFSLLFGRAFLWTFAPLLLLFLIAGAVRVRRWVHKHGQG